MLHRRCAPARRGGGTRGCGWASPWSPSRCSSAPGCSAGPTTPSRCGARARTWPPASRSPRRPRRRGGCGSARRRTASTTSASATGSGRRDPVAGGRCRQLLPAGALGAAEEGLTEVPIWAPAEVIPASIEPGSVVDVWVTPTPGAGNMAKGSVLVARRRRRGRGAARGGLLRPGRQPPGARRRAGRSGTRGRAGAGRRQGQPHRHHPAGLSMDGIGPGRDASAPASSWSPPARRGSPRPCAS